MRHGKHLHDTRSGNDLGKSGFGVFGGVLHLLSSSYSMTLTTLSSLL